MSLHDPDAFELEQAFRTFRGGEQTLPEICNDLGIRPGPVYDYYVEDLKENREVPESNRVRVNVDQHAGFDRVYNDLPIMVNQISGKYPKYSLYELADYEPLPDTEWVIFFIPNLGFIKLYTSLFYDLGCYLEALIPDSSRKREAERLVEKMRIELNRFYREKSERETSLSHG